MGFARAACIACLATTPALAAAHTGVLYKSVDENGVVTFSDVRPPETSRILEERPIPSIGAPPPPPMPGWSEELLYEAQWADSDLALAKANAELDAAENALAEARRDAAGPILGPVRLKGAGSVDHAAGLERLEREKRRVHIARKRLLDVLRDRRLAATARGGTIAIAAAAR